MTSTRISRSPTPLRKSTRQARRIAHRAKQIGAKVRVPVVLEEQDDFRVAEDAAAEVEVVVMVHQEAER